MIQSNYTMPQIDYFTGGDSEEYYFEIKNEQGHPMDVSTMGLKFSIIDYTNKFGQPLLVKDGEPSLNTKTSMTSDFKVVLTPTDTLNLFGKYIYQISIVDYDKNVKNYQGIMVISNNINKMGVASLII